MSSGVWRRVSQTLPCLVCGAATGCLTSKTGSHLVCCSQPSGMHYPKLGGWAHAGQLYAPRTAEVIWKQTTPFRMHPVQDFAARLAPLVDAFDSQQRDRAAKVLGLLPRCFDAYPIGYCEKRDSLAIPAMEIGTPEFIGLRYRAFVNVSGLGHWGGAFQSTSGLLLPRALPEEGKAILLCRGPCDAFAASGLALHAIGRWSPWIDDFQIETLKQHTKLLAAPTIIVVGDNEDEDGVTRSRAADWTASRISHAIERATVLRLQPPDEFTSLRQWTLAGASPSELCSKACPATREPWHESEPEQRPTREPKKPKPTKKKAKKSVQGGSLATPCAPTRARRSRKAATVHERP